MTFSPAAPIRVMLVDDHAMVRKGLAAFMLGFEDLLLVGEADSGEAAIRLCASCAPDVILMDMRLPQMDGAMTTRAIRQAWPQVQVIVLSSFNEPQFIKSALEAGAIGYLIKDVTADELVKAIRAASDGRATLSPAVTQTLVQAATLAPRPGFDLTEREMDVLALMVEGLNNAQIAARLTVSPSTVKSHVSNILSKLEVSSRTEAASLALRTGMVA
jgi:NarL family two-component system response regulator LiaR